MIVSDHSPCPGDMKLRDSGDFLAAWGGIASLQLRLPIVWTEAQRRGFSLARWRSGFVKIRRGRFELESRKGSIAAGSRRRSGHLGPDREFVVDAAALHHRHKLTPYHGDVNGVVRKTFLRGKRLYCVVEHNL